MEAPVIGYRVVTGTLKKVIIACGCGERRTIPRAEWRRAYQGTGRSCPQCFFKRRGRNGRPGFSNRLDAEPASKKHPLILFRCPNYEGLQVTPGGCAKAHLQAKGGSSRLYRCATCPIGAENAAE